MPNLASSFATCYYSLLEGLESPCGWCVAVDLWSFQPAIFYSYLQKEKIYIVNVEHSEGKIYETSINIPGENVAPIILRNQANITALHFTDTDHI